MPRDPYFAMAVGFIEGSRFHADDAPIDEAHNDQIRATCSGCRAWDLIACELHNGEVGNCKTFPQLEEVERNSSCNSFNPQIMKVIASSGPLHDADGNPIPGAWAISEAVEPEGH